MDLIFKPIYFYSVNRDQKEQTTVSQDYSKKFVSVFNLLVMFWLLLLRLQFFRGEMLMVLPQQIVASLIHLPGLKVIAANPFYTLSSFH